MMEKQIHIAMLIGALTKGGAERVLVNLADYFAEKGYRVTMVTQYQKENEYLLNEKVKRVISDISQEETTGNRLVNFKRRFRKLRNIWKAERPDVILSFIGKNNMMAILTSRFLRIPVAVSVRAEPKEEYYHTWMRFMARCLFAWADGVILQTRRCFDFFPEKVRRKAIILQNPVSAVFFRERYEGVREKTIVAVGRVDENKNHEMIIRAFAEIAQEFSDYKLIIYGDGECRKKLMELVEEKKLSEQVLLPGSIDNVADAIYKAHIFVLSSNSEGVPNTLIEAMVMGLAVISTDCPCGGPADLIENGKNGILTPVGDIASMREHLRSLLADTQMADKLGIAAAGMAKTYRPEHVYGGWEKFLLSLLKNR
ncbi:glycosyltransferase [Parablautia muri]|nr:glycosyltransferase [Parablautia muri]